MKVVKIDNFETTQEQLNRNMAQAIEDAENDPEDDGEGSEEIEDISCKENLCRLDGLNIWTTTAL